MSGGHLAAAISTASSHAARLDRDVHSHTPESFSVYGSLLLRGAIAAAQHDQRATAQELLEEADGAAQRLGADGNLRRTAFGPANARLHRVNIAVTLGDAGRLRRLTTRSISGRMASATPMLWACWRRSPASIPRSWCSCSSTRHWPARRVRDRTRHQNRIGKILGDALLKISGLI